MNEVLFILAYFNIPCGLHFIRCCQDLECSGTLYIIPLSIIFPDALFSLYSPLKSPMKIVLYYIASIVPRSVVLLRSSFRILGPDPKYSRENDRF
jgi:hypothetical protein